ncbi:hypothetical protein EBZ39_04890 [bacterium]|nr:hypothetical protein [bacterium]
MNRSYTVDGYDAGMARFFLSLVPLVIAAGLYVGVRLFPPQPEPAPVSVVQEVEEGSDPENAHFDRVLIGDQWVVQADPLAVQEALLQAENRSRAEPDSENP